MARRHRFFALMPVGGRLLSFRWMMHGPVESLSNEAREQRRQMLARYPQYQLWSDRIQQIRTSLSLLPRNLDPESSEFKQQVELLAEMEAVSLQQDSFLARHALSRMPVDMVFPPQIQISDLRREISEKQLALVCFATYNGVHLFFLDANLTRYVGLLSPRDLQRSVPNLLKAIGASETSIDVASLQSDGWKKNAEQATKSILGEISADDWSQYKELVVVPDGILWYFPFELIQAKRGDEEFNLIDLLDIRYSPTLSLAFVPQRPQRELQSTAVTLAKIHTKGEKSVVRKAFESLGAEMPDAVKFETVSKNVSTRLLATLFDQVVIWEEILLSGGLQAMDLIPISLGPANPISLGRWMRLPLEGPEQIIFSSFHSDAGSGLRGKKGGSDLFVTSVILMGSGSRNLLISRWRTGGANSLEFTKTFAQKAPQMPNSDALRESLAIARDLELDYSLEPQIKLKKDDPPIKADHPYFWATWMRFEVPSTNAPPIDDEEILDQQLGQQAEQEGDDQGMNPKQDGIAEGEEQGEKSGAQEEEKVNQKEDDQIKEDPKGINQKEDDSKKDGLNF